MSKRWIGGKALREARNEVAEDFAIPGSIRGLVGVVEFLSSIGGFFIAGFGVAGALFLGLQIPPLRWPSMFASAAFSVGVLQLQRYLYIRTARWALRKGHVAISGALGGGSSSAALPAGKAERPQSEGE